MNIKKMLVVGLLALTLSLGVVATSTATDSGKAEAAVPTYSVQGPPYWSSGWSAPQCVYLYMCVEAMATCIIVGYEISCTAYARTVSSPPEWDISVRAELYNGGYPPVAIGLKTKDCGRERNWWYEANSCYTSANGWPFRPGPIVARGIAWRNGDPSPRPIATASIYIVP